MKKFLLLLLATVLLASACGDDGDDTDIGADPDDDGTVVDGGDDPVDDAPADDTPSDGDLPGGDGSDDLPGDDLPLGAGPYPIADLTVTVDPGETEEANASYRLSCLGDTATVTDESGAGAPNSADAMCRALNDPAIRNRVILGPPTDVACTEIYGGPEVATITGTLDGESVDASFDRTNGCGIADWDLFAAFFPAPA